MVPPRPTCNLALLLEGTYMKIGHMVECRLVGPTLVLTKLVLA